MKNSSNTIGNRTRDLPPCLYTFQNFHIVAARGPLFLGNSELCAEKNMWAPSVTHTAKPNAVLLFTNPKKPRKPKAQYHIHDSPTATTVLNEVNL